MKDEIQFIKTRLLEEYKEVIELVIVYGSYARGNFSEFSDLDMFILIDSEERYSGLTSLPWIFQYRNVIVDCWESNWKHHEKDLVFIKEKYFLYPISGLLDCDILYYRNEEALERFRKLQNDVRAVITNKEENMKLLLKDFSLAEAVYGILKAKRNNDLPSARMTIWHSIIHFITVLARLNNTYYKRNWGKNLYEAFNLEISRSI